jgi:hypothetical protein
VWRPIAADLEPDLPALPVVTQRWPLILQQEESLKLAVSDYVDRIVDRRGLRQRVITQPRPGADHVGKVALEPGRSPSRHNPRRGT